MKLSILMACLKSRPYHWLVTELARQIDGRDVELLTAVDSGEDTSGFKRQLLLNKASGDYICYVDDDDEVSPDYVSSLLGRVTLGVDVISFNMDVDMDGRRRERWALRIGADERRNGLMSVNHLCAWRREIATQVAWHPKLGYGDDQMWYKPLLLSGLVKTESHIHKSLYHYRYNSSRTANQRREIVERSRMIIGPGMDVFLSSDKRILLLDRMTDDPALICVRDRFNSIELITPSELEKLGTVRLV